jgi:hypothetical protein
VSDGVSLAVDFDGTIVENDLPFRIRFGADSALHSLKQAGCRLVLFSSRCNTFDDGPLLDEEIGRFYVDGRISQRVLDQWERFLEMRVFLKEKCLWGLFDEIWQAPGKPRVDVYIDDKAEIPNWLQIAEGLGAHGK